MTKRILVAVDGSSHSLRAVDIAVDLAKQRGCALRLVHVIPSSSVPSGLQKWAKIEHVHESSQWLYDEGLADRVLNDAQDRIADANDIDTDRYVDHGDAAKCIIGKSKDAETEMVVLGSRGLSDFGGLVLGSVAHKVAHSAGCPVVTVT